MLNSAAPDFQSSGQSAPCPSCGGETTEEFVANGPSKGLRTTCQTCGPIDVMSISVFELPDDDGTDTTGGEPAEAEPFRFREPSRDEPATDGGLSFVEPDPAPAPEPAPASPESGSNADGGFSFAPREEAPAPEHILDDPLPLDDGSAEEPDLAESASQILEEAAVPDDAGAHDDIAQVGGGDASFEMTPGLAAGPVRRTGIDAAGRSRNRQVALVALGGIAALAGLVGLDLYLRPLQPGTEVAKVAAPQPASAAPTNVEPAAAKPDAAAARASGSADAPVQPSLAPKESRNPAPAAKVAKAPPAKPAERVAPASVERPKPTQVARATTADSRPEPDLSHSRWFSQTGVPPTRHNAIVNAGAYAPEAAAARVAAAPRTARSGNGPGLVREAVAVRAPAFDPHPEWRNLRPRMSADEVLGMLGRPRWTSKSVALEFWMYEQQSIMGSGVVVFDNRGVYSWREPSHPLPPG